MPLYCKLSRSGSMKRQWFKLPLHQLLHALHTGEASLPEIVASFYERIAIRDDRIGAWQYLIDQDDYLAEYGQRGGQFSLAPKSWLATRATAMIGAVSTATWASETPWVIPNTAIAGTCLRAAKSK